MNMRKRSALLAAVAVLAFASPVMAVGSTGTKGSPVPVPSPGKSVTITLPATKSSIPNWNPVDTVTVTGLDQATATRMQAASQAAPQLGKAVPQSGLLATGSGCWSSTWQHGTSQLWAKMQQYWCGDGRYITYWPAASCWGYSAWYTPNYNYLGCQTHQVYGLWWNQGRTIWDSDLCPGWVKGAGCVSHDYWHATYYFTPNGASWRL